MEKQKKIDFLGEAKKKLFSYVKLVKYQRKYAVPKKLYVECVNICNAACVFCPYPLIESELDKKSMPMGLFEKIVSEFSVFGGETIGLTPTLGDPLADPLFHERISLCDHFSIPRIHFYTNLINLREKHLDAFRALKSSRVHVVVSFVGFDREAYKRFMGVDAYDRTISNLQKLASLNSRFVDLEVTLRTYKDCDEAQHHLLEFLTGLGLKTSVMTDYDTWGGQVTFDDDLRSVLSIKNKKEIVGPCERAYSRPAITVNGDMKMCESKDVYGELVVGNVGNQKILELWNSSVAVEFRKNFLINGSLPDVCSNCEQYNSIF